MKLGICKAKQERSKQKCGEKIINGAEKCKSPLAKIQAKPEQQGPDHSILG